MRMCYWKQWRWARTKIKNLLALGVSLKSAIQHGVSSKSYWHMARTPVTQQALNNTWLAAQDHPYKSTGLRDYQISGCKDIPFGYDVSVRDEAALDALLLRLSTETSTPSGAATASSLGSTEIQFAEPELPDTDEAAAIAIDRDPKCTGESPTTRLALINARMGQGGYRRRMLQLWQGQCAVTGCAEPVVLIASHAKSWAESSNIERLDEFNGLLLSAALDRLFDHGLISFADDGVMLTKRVLRSFDLQCLGLQLDARLRFLRPRHQLYLAAHRAHFGF